MFGVKNPEISHLKWRPFSVPIHQTPTKPYSWAKVKMLRRVQLLDPPQVCLLQEIQTLWEVAWEWLTRLNQAPNPWASYRGATSWMMAEEGSDNCRSEGMLSWGICGFVLGFLKRGETSELGKRRRLFEQQLFSPPQQQNTPLILILLSSHSA